MSAASVISEEVARFDALGDNWWDPAGPMAPLHRINPLRIAWLRDAIAAHFRRSGDGPLEGLDILDIGCGAGLLAEPLSRLGAVVSGIDPAAGLVEVARAHAAATGADLTYRVGTVEDLAREGAKFDVVLAMEVVEHVNDVPAFVASAASLREAWRPDRALHPQPHAEELRIGDRRRGIRAALARPRHAPLGAVRDAGRIGGGVACGGAPGETAAGDGLRPAAAGVAAVAGFGSELLHDGGLVRRVVQNEVL